MSAETLVYPADISRRIDMRRVKDDRSAFLYVRQMMTRYPVRSSVPVNGQKRWISNQERCVYHHPNGVFRCPIGHLIAPSVYKANVPAAWRTNPSRETTWGRILDSGDGESVVNRHALEAIRLSIGFIPDVSLLLELQELHDNYLPGFWQPQLDAIGAWRGFL